MAELNELRAERLKKLQNLENLGINCFPSKIELAGVRVDSQIATKNLENNSNLTDILMAGRVMTIRGQGKILFVDIFDEAGKFQFVLKEDILGDKQKLFFDHIDAGDFVAFSGNLFTTERGQKSMEVHNWQILAKAILPIPSTFYGLENEEEKLRKRYLDFALNKEKRDVFFRKAKFWQVTRNFLVERGFLEVDTPTIETTTGGAEARPFKTFHNDFDMEVYMRICVGELWQKRLLAGGFSKTFEIGRAYRNEGSSPMHLQEFTNCEFYWAYADYRDGMKLVKDLYLEIANKVYGKTEFNIGEHTFDLASEWKEIEYRDEIKNRTGIDIFNTTEEEVKSKLKELGVKWDGENMERLMDTLWKYCRKQISGPAFLVGHPRLVSPLSKPRADGMTVERFQPILGGAEIGNGFSELNDARVQKKNFDQQQELIDKGDDEAMMPDLEFVEMLEHAMPPAFGYGFGERFFTFLEGTNMRETSFFPLVKEKVELKKEGTKVAVAIINKGAELEKWQELNTIGHLAAEFAGHTGNKIFKFDSIKTKDAKKINLNMQHPIVIKSTDSNLNILNFIESNPNEKVYSFTREMLNTTNDKKIMSQTQEKNFAEVEFLGILIFGEKEKMEELTKDFARYS